MQTANLNYGLPRWVGVLLAVIQLVGAIYGIILGLPFHGIGSIIVFALSAWVILCIILFFVLVVNDVGINKILEEIISWSGFTLLYGAILIFDPEDN